MNKISQLESFSVLLPYWLIEVTAGLAKWRLFSEAEQIKDSINKTGKTIAFKVIPLKKKEYLKLSKTWSSS